MTVRLETIFTFLAIISLMTAIGAAVYAVDSDGTHKPETEFYVATTDENGDIVGANYPRYIPTSGRTDPVMIGVRNHLPTSQTYVLQVQIQAVSIADSETTVTERYDIQSKQIQVPADDEATTQVRLSAPREANVSRVVFLLYRGQPPDTPSITSAHRWAYFWLNESVSDTTRPSSRNSS